MEPLVIDYLRTHSAAELLRDHGVKFAIGTRPYKASLNYDQELVKDENLLARECRGLILATPDGSSFPVVNGSSAAKRSGSTDIIGETIVLARPMDRFFNYGAGAAPAIDLVHPESRVFEKLDGTLCIVYFDIHAREWCVATRSVPDADRTIDGFGEHTFGTLFEHALMEHLGETFTSLVNGLRHQYTYCYELTTPQNRLVVDTKEPKVHTLAIRHLNGDEVCPTTDRFEHAVPVCPSWPLRSPEDLFAFVNSRPPSESEGVVVRLPGFRRVKVKSIAYRASAKLRDEVRPGPRGLLECVLVGQDEDVFPMLPEYMQKAGAKIKTAFEAWVAKYDAAYPRLFAESGGDRKRMAVVVQRDGFLIGPMMELFSGRCTSTRGWVDRARKPEGWGDAFLDNLVTQISE